MRAPTKQGYGGKCQAGEVRGSITPVRRAGPGDGRIGGKIVPRRLEAHTPPTSPEGSRSGEAVWGRKDRISWNADSEDRMEAGTWPTEMTRSRFAGTLASRPIITLTVRVSCVTARAES
jgi:hypothetical protein